MGKKKSSNPFDIKRLELLNEAGDENRIIRLAFLTNLSDMFLPIIMCIYLFW